MALAAFRRQDKEANAAMAAMQQKKDDEAARVAAAEDAAEGAAEAVADGGGAASDDDGTAAAAVEAAAATEARPTASFGAQSPPWVLLASLKACGVGLNLTVASVIIMLDPWWYAMSLNVFAAYHNRHISSRHTSPPQEPGR